MRVAILSARELLQRELPSAQPALFARTRASASRRSGRASDEDAAAHHLARAQGRAQEAQARPDPRDAPRAHSARRQAEALDRREATIAKSAVAREGLARIGRIFELDATWRSRPPSDINRLRDAHLRPHVDAFFAWVEAEYEAVRHQRGLLCSALGYAHRQQHALTRFFDDGRLALDNNRSERALRSVAVGRKAWLFAGSDDHAVSTSHLFTLVASARLHGLDPEAYLRDMIRVVPHWPRDRYLELAPLFWKQTRDRLVPAELDAEIGPLTIPEPLPTRTATEQQASG